MASPLNFPDIGAPFVDEDGKLSPVWFRFLIQIFSRSGGGSNPSSLGALIDQLAQQAASQVPLFILIALEQRLSDIEAQIVVPLPALASSDPESIAPTHGLQDEPDLHAVATQTANGFLSSADKAKLDGITAIVEDKFVSGTGFTPGTTTSLTLSKSYASATAVLVHFDGTFQGSDQYSITGTTITFTSPIPVGTQTVYARG